MGLRDRLRRRAPADAEEAAPGATAAAAAARDDVTDFDPRSDGDYHCIARGLYLRFARPAVTETDGAHPDPARGEFTSSGRFVVQRSFARPVVYTVLEARADLLTMRRTDTGDGDSAELEFAFEPDDR